MLTTLALGRRRQLGCEGERRRVGDIADDKAGSSRTSARPYGGLVLTIVLSVLSGISPTRAATLTVDTTVDDPAATACTDATPNDCSLRGAIIKVNGLSEASTIVVPAGTYLLSQPTACLYRSHQFGNFSLNSTPLCIDADLTLVGAGAGSTIIDGSGIDHVIMVSDRTVELRGVTVTNGLAPLVSSYLGNLAGGGGIVNGGTLTLVDSVVSNNSAPRDGGGIYNGHVLTLLRSRVTQNISGGGAGGGIANMSFFEITPLAILDSSIDTNRAMDGGGGGIFNFGGAVIVSGSTISGNQTPQVGGGVFNLNNSGVLTVTNSTISGNSSDSAGAGIYTSGLVVDLNNVTITANSSKLNATGGIYNQGSTVTLSNTLIAGNHEGVNFGPDCGGSSFTSKGHNLIQSLTATCQLTGDTTGNITGQDPRLGVLADNGGATKTHALIAGSPAIDAGNPAAPGGGGAACTLSDQRGLLRPRGSACDIGAFERVTELSISSILPDGDANVAPAIAHISGNGFAPGATVALRRQGQQDIVGSPAAVEGGSSEIATVFDLTGKVTGVWDVVVTNPDGRSATLPGGFVIDQEPVPAALWVSFSGRQAIRGGSVSELTIFFGNLGNTDALGVPLSLSIPQAFTGALLFRITPPPLQVNQVPTDWTQVPIDTLTPAAGYYNFSLLLPVVPAGYTGALQFEIASGSVEHGATFTFLVSLGLPVFAPDLDPLFVSGVTAGAQAYAQKNLGTTIPAALLPQMNQYAASQFQTIVQNGRNALISSFGTEPQVYSLGQLTFDVARFGAQRATGGSP